MKTIHVAAAVIGDSPAAPRRVFATARGYGEYRGRWEFPGGKLEPGESPQQALVREIREELDVCIEVGELISTIEYDYPAFHLSMACFWCTVTHGTPRLVEAEAGRWLTRAQLRDVDWLPADLLVLDAVGAQMNDPEA